MKHKALVFIAITAIVALSLIVAHGVLASGSFAPVSQPASQLKLDGAGASFSAVDGSTASGGDFTFEPSSFPPNRLTQDDVANIPYWDTDSGHIGVPGIDNGTVYALAVAEDGTVYVGGDFTAAGGVAAADYIAQWNADGWSALSSDITGPVYALAIQGSDVYVGGEFSDPDFGAYPINNFARWDGSRWWPLRGGVNGPVNAIAIAEDGDVYLGGDFTEAVNSGTTVNGIARWSPSPKGWHDLDGGVTDNFYSPGTVNALAVNGADVYVGGDFDYAGGDAAAYLARWDSDASQWESLGSKLAREVDGLDTNGSELYVAERTHVSGGFCFHQYSLTDEAWSQLTECANSKSDDERIYAVAASQNNIFVGGEFTTTGTTSANWIAHWNSRDENWSVMGSSVSGPSDPDDNDGVHALALDGPSLYAGGTFTQADGEEANRLAHWVQPIADLGLVQSVSPTGTVYAGEQITYEVTLMHHGYHQATDVLLEYNLPDTVTDVVPSDGGVYEAGTHTVRWDWTTLEAESRATRRVVALVPGDTLTGTTLTNIVDVEADQYDPALSAVFPANNDYLVTNTVHVKAVLELGKIAPATVDVGDVLAYTLVVTNTGPSAASNVTLEDTLPPGVWFDAASAGCNGNDTRVTCGLGAMPPSGPGSVKTVTIEVVPSVADVLTNTAQATAPEAERTATATATTEVSGTVGLNIMKTDGLGEVGLNEPLTYTVRAWNSGGAGVPDVSITDTLPTTVTLRSVDVSQGTCSGSSTIICDVGTLNSGEQVTLTIGVTPTAEGRLVNTAMVGDDLVETKSDDDTDTLVRNVADLQLTKSGPGTATTGQPFDYQISVVNDGPASTSDVVLTDDLPDGLYLNSVTGGVTCASSGGPESALVECDIGELANGERVDVTLNVTPLGPDVISNTASVTSTKSDDEPDDNQETVETTIQAGDIQTDTVDGLTITAYVFIDLGGGQTRAYGVLSLGEHFYMAGPNDSVIFDSDSLTGTGTLALKEGELPVFEGQFTAAAPGWNLAFVSGGSALPHLAGFVLDSSDLSGVNLLSGQIGGSTTELRLEPPGCSAIVVADFTITPGPVFSGTIKNPFTMVASAFNLEAPAGATLSNDGVTAEPVDLVLPAYFGAGVVEGASLLVKPDSLRLGGVVGVGFDLPDLRFDNQDTLVIKNAEGVLVRKGDAYVIVMRNGELHVTLPGNTPIIPLGEVRLTAAGEIEVERLSEFDLEIAGGALTINRSLLTNPELAVSAAIFQWPENLGGKYKNVPDVHITAGGVLTISAEISAGNVDIPLPDIELLGGETLRVNDPIADLIEEIDGYSFEITGGEVQVMLLQQNDHTLDLDFGEVDVDGHFRGRMVQDTLTLQVAGAELTLDGLSSGWPLDDQNGLAILPDSSAPLDQGAVGQGTWELPASLGGGTLTFDAPIVIDGDGLSVNDGKSVSFPDAFLDDGGFPLLNNTVTLGEGDDRTYELDLSGAISVTLPGFSGFTDGDLTMDSLANFSGSADGLDMLLGGLELGVDSFFVDGGQLLTDGGTLSAPPGFGGDQITLNGMGVLDADMGLIGWGIDEQGNVTSATVELPSITLNGYDVFAMEGSFRRVDRLPYPGGDGVDDGYEVTGHGLMRAPGFSTNMNPNPPKKPDGSYKRGKSCSGFEVSFALIIGTDSRTHMTIIPASVPTTVDASPSLLASGGPLAAPTQAGPAYAISEVASDSSLRMVAVDGTLYCSIDIPELMISVGNPRLNGGWDRDQELVWLGGGISVWTMMSVLGHPVASGDVDALIQATPDWQSFDITGTMKILDMWEAGRATGHIEFEDGIPLDLEVERMVNDIVWLVGVPIPMEGTAGFHVWTDWDPDDPDDVELDYFHFTGWAYLTIGLEEGVIAEDCADLGIFEACVTMPPMDLELAEVGAEIGQFRTDSGTPWGLKAQIEVLNLYETGIYVDTEGNVDFGDVNEYVLLDSDQTRAAREAWTATQRGHPLAAPAIADYELLSFATSSITRTVPVETPTDLAFMLSRNTAVPTMTLVSPSGTLITPGTTISGVAHFETYTETLDTYSDTVPLTQTTYLVGDAEAGDWKVVLHGEITDDNDYILGVIGANPAPTLTDVNATASGDTGADVSWRLASEELTTTLNIHATAGPITDTLTVTHTDGTTGPVTSLVYLDGPVALDVDTPVNGAQGSASVDLSHLESGDYWIWVEANDGDNAPVRVYAPDPVAVTQSPPDSWSPTIVVTPTYLGLEIDWEPLDHPDVDGYVAYVSDSPSALGRTAVITTPWASTLIDSWLEPGRTYYIVIDAFDADAGWTVRSSRATGVPLAAGFELTTTTPSVTVAGGGATGLEVGVVRTGDVTPTVFLYGGDLPDGLDIAFTSSRWVTPTLDGTPVSLVISATDTMYGGFYTATIAAFGGGGLETLDVQVEVEEPHFVLTATPDAVNLYEDMAATVTISATGFNGESDPIHLEVEGAPPGLGWRLSDDLVYPGGEVTLTISDTFLIDRGEYELHVIGDDGENEYDLALSVEIIEPAFDLAALPQRSWILLGDEAVYALEVSALYGWTAPVTLTLGASTLPPHTAGGFAAAPDGAPQAELSVTPSQTVYLIVATPGRTAPLKPPEDLYLIDVKGEGGGKQEALDLELVLLSSCVEADLSASFVEEQFIVQEPVGSIDLGLQVSNDGALMPAGLPVSLYITETQIGTAFTTQPLGPGDSETVTITWDVRSTGDYTLTIALNDWENEESRRVLCSMPHTEDQVIKVTVLAPVGGYTELACTESRPCGGAAATLRSWVILLAMVVLVIVVSERKRRRGSF